MTVFALLALATAALPYLEVDSRIFEQDDDSPAAVLAGTSTSATLVWPSGTKLELEHSGNEVIVRSNRAVDEQSLSALQAAAASRIADLRWNDRTVLISMVPDATATVTINRNIVKLDWLAPAVASPALTAGQRDTANEERERQILDIQVDLASGFPETARRKALALTRAQPDDLQLWRLLADCEAATQDYKAAARHYRKAKATDRQARRVIALSQGTANLATSYRGNADFQQVELIGKARLSVSDTTDLGVQVQKTISTEAQAQPSSTTADILEIAASITLAPRLQADFSGTTWVDQSVTGGKARLVYGGPQANIYAHIARNLPDLTFASQARMGGFLHQWGAGGRLQVSSAVQLHAEYARRVYGIARQSAGTTDFLAGGATLIVLRKPQLSLAYQFDAEYVKRLASLPPALALPLGNRENHSLLAYWNAALGPVAITSGLGWTLDRYGGDGPNASVAMNLPLGEHWQLAANGGLSSISRPGFPQSQTYARLSVVRALGSFE